MHRTELKAYLLKRGKYALAPNELRFADVSPLARMLWLHLYSEGSFTSSQRRIAHDLGVGEATIKRALDELVLAGMVVKNALGRGRKCSYSFPSPESWRVKVPAKRKPVASRKFTGSLFCCGGEYVSAQALLIHYMQRHEDKVDEMKALHAERLAEEDRGW